MPEEVEVSDPTHPLYGQRFPVLAVSQSPQAAGQVWVAFREGIRLRLPAAATSLAPALATQPRTRFTQPAVEEFLALVKEYALPCPLSPPASGPNSPNR
jgi:hypothetical protein